MMLPMFSCGKTHENEKFKLCQRNQELHQELHLHHHGSSRTPFPASYLPPLAFIAVMGIIYAATKLLCTSKLRNITSSDGKTTTNNNITPVSLLEVKVSLPTKLIFKDEAMEFDSSELAQLPKTRLGEGTLGPLFKVVLDCGSIVTIRKIRDGFVRPDDLEFWINFFAKVNSPLLLPIQFSFWYGGEAFVLYEYFCLGSLEELLHGSEGIQFTPLSWHIRKEIAKCAAMAVAAIHSMVTKNGQTCVCGVIKSSNILIRVDFSACLSGYETPYLVPPATIIRRNPGRVAPELRTTTTTTTHNHQSLGKVVLTSNSDVYSFGVLLLELVTGLRPSAIDLEEHVRGHMKRNGRMKDLCDERMEEMLGVALQCISYQPNKRPSMDEVVQMLLALKD